MKSLVAIRVRGTVQGVGFRPTVWRLAREEDLVGDVRNDADGVLIRAAGADAALVRFVDRLRAEPPPLARIETIDVVTWDRQSDRPTTDSRESETSSSDWFERDDFVIVESAVGGSHTRIAPDAATCSACLREVFDPADRRFGYSFANCTHCGPRFSIVTAIPYDRARTTMADFALCDACRREYENPRDRRFHAQPIACPACGPQVWFESAGNDAPVAATARRATDALRATVQSLLDGRIVAIRGLGGFHLACDATNAAAVERLRLRKRRDRKPFALMARDLDVVRRYCRVGREEAALLTSVEAPIVLLEHADDGSNTDGTDFTEGTDRAIGNYARLPESLAPGVDLLGFMLPYTPLHALLMQEIERPLVMTSGNVSDEPQVTSVDDALARLADIADAFLMHDREIANRIDDSVVVIAAGEPRVVRRARGYAPAAIRLPHGFERAPEILAYGAELKATFCLVKDGAAVLSQHQGDLEDASTLADYEHHLALYSRMYDHRPTVLAVDRHPEYLATKTGRTRSERDELPLLEVQHHHAHLTACMAENGVPLESPPLLGIALDGLGLGDDGTLWGGEFLLADYRGYRRLAAFPSIAMPGGAQAIREPWRNTYAHIAASLGWDDFAARYRSSELLRWLDGKPIRMIDRMIQARVNSPPASSCGRLFDAVAAPLGISADHASYEGQCAAELETLATRAMRRTSGDIAGYPIDVIEMIDGASGTRDPADVVPWRFGFAPLWQALCDDLLVGVPIDLIAAKFHVGVARAIGRMIRTIESGESQDTAVGGVAVNTSSRGPNARFGSVVLSGGCWQNRLLLQLVVNELQNDGRRCLLHARVPTNDGGLSLGQAVVAAATVSSL